MYSGHLNDVQGMAVGHREDEAKGTGVTVILPPREAPPGRTSEAARPVPGSASCFSPPMPWIRYTPSC